MDLKTILKEWNWQAKKLLKKELSSFNWKCSHGDVIMEVW